MKYDFTLIVHAEIQISRRGRGGTRYGLEEAVGVKRRASA
jgi:hypothetical protein